MRKRDRKRELRKRRHFGKEQCNNARERLYSRKLYWRSCRKRDEEEWITVQCRLRQSSWRLLSYRRSSSIVAFSSLSLSVSLSPPPPPPQRSLLPCTLCSSFSTACFPLLWRVPECFSSLLPVIITWASVAARELSYMLLSLLPSHLLPASFFSRYEKVLSPLSRPSFCLPLSLSLSFSLSLFFLQSLGRVIRASLCSLSC